ncbi:uncharacterized protein LOC112271474 [Brachypodium distachyon]|uniref:uncharacterized protein LOC112271474 n=1 Tax=Brachypodium distachyon TaxID=15368 RepID=UPI0001C741C1|nr:uncharacterized protein LOC112271474 [Brachypodium distachyon]|eukprot:XP_024316378.1 uncharacterized protein LOC112271474 [Brachypodium distachyon]
MTQSSSSSRSSVWPRYGVVPLTQCPNCPRVEPLVRLTCKKLDTGNFDREFVKCESRPQPGKLLSQCTFFMWMDSYVEKLQLEGKLQGREEETPRTDPRAEEGSEKAALLFLKEMTSMNEKLSKIVELRKEELQVAKLFYACIVMLGLILVGFRF